MKTSAHIEVHPSVMFKLGEDLISDEFQAVAELVKNAYDADSPDVIVRIVTGEGPPEFPTDRGYVEVIDRGVGMSMDDIRTGWLTLSNSRKREQKAAGITTREGRTPLGDKGLGRLGAQRLGSRLSIKTDQGNGDGVHTLTLDWRDFTDKYRLSQVDLSIVTEPSSGPRGTSICISDLRDPERLSNVSEVERALAAIVSPFGGVAKFKMRGSVNGERLDLEGLEQRLRGAATVAYRFDYKPETGDLRIKGRMRLRHLRPSAKKDRLWFDEMCEKDNGRDLLAFLHQSARGEEFSVREAKAKGWWLEFGRTVRLEDLKLTWEPRNEDLPAAATSTRTDDTPRKPAQPGPFSGEVEVFNLSSGATEELDGFDSLKLLREQVTQRAGIHVYRDGFTVRVGEDWLRIGRGATSAGSWYGLRPGNTIGYIELTAAHNAQLIETTDREGFSRTPHFENFELLMREFVSATHDLQEFVGRGFVDYRRETISLSDSGSQPDASDMTERLTETLAVASGLRPVVAEIRSQLEDDATHAAELVDRMIAEGADIDDDRQELLTAVNALGRHAARAAGTVEDLEAIIVQLDQQRGVGLRLQAELESIEHQLAATYETMAVGLLAEALTHEIANIADRLARRTSQIAGHLKRYPDSDRRMVRFVEHVRGSVSGLRRQVAHISPTLRYVREQRETIIISEFLEELGEYYESRWRDDSIELSVEVQEDFAIEMNRGKLLQVVDNLVLNSEYWLRQRLEMGLQRIGKVNILVLGNRIDVFDNGRGVEPEIENSLFGPFVTRKPAGVGRGLGLFIARRLLEVEGCTVELLQERNEDGRRFIFSIYLSGALTDA